MVFVMVKNKHHNVMENRITTNLENKYLKKKKKTTCQLLSVTVQQSADISRRRAG